MLFGLFSHNNTPLAKVLKSWIKNPQTELSGELKKLSEKEVRLSSEAQLIGQSLKTMQAVMQHSFDEKTEDNLYQLVSLFQEATSKEAASLLNEDGIPLLEEILNIVEEKGYAMQPYSSCEMMVLKMFSLYKNERGLKKLTEFVDKGFKNDNYLWSIVLGNIAEDEMKYAFVIRQLNGKIPSGFLGICYLDMCNTISIRSTQFPHPFDTAKGHAFLSDMVEKSTDSEESHVVSVCTSLPFLSEPYRSELLQELASYPAVSVQLEAAWAGAKMGDERSAGILVDFAKDYRYNGKAVDYLKELRLDQLIPAETVSPDFQALSEMCKWLSHPMEFGSYPDSAEVYDQKTLYWPPTKDQRTLYLIKYTYLHFTEDGSDEIGIGLVGSVTFSLFGLENILRLSPLEILAIHCNWELEMENYQDPKGGLELLKRHNKDLS